MLLIIIVILTVVVSWSRRAVVRVRSIAGIRCCGNSGGALTFPNIVVTNKKRQRNSVVPLIYPVLIRSGNGSIISHADDLIALVLVHSST